MQLTFPIYIFLDLATRSVWCTMLMELYPLIQINVGAAVGI